MCLITCRKKTVRRKEREVLELLKRYTLEKGKEIAECAIGKNLDDGSSVKIVQNPSHIVSNDVAKFRLTKSQEDKESIQQISRTEGLRLGASTEQIQKFDTVESITPLCSWYQTQLQTALKENFAVAPDMEYRAENRKVVGSAKKYEGFIPKLHVQSLLQSGADDQNEHKVWCYDLTTDYIESCDEETYRTNVRKSKARNELSSSEVNFLFQTTCKSKHEASYQDCTLATNCLETNVQNEYFDIDVIGISMVMISQRKRALIKKRRRARENTAIMELGCIFAIVVYTVSSYL